MTEPRDGALDDLPAPPIDPSFASRVQRRARAAQQDRGLLPRELPVPVLLIAAGVAYTAASFELMLRIFT